MTMATATAENAIPLEEPVQYLTFTLDGESFATDIAQVREVLEFSRITKVPRTPDYTMPLPPIRPVFFGNRNISAI